MAGHVTFDQPEPSLGGKLLALPWPSSCWSWLWG